MAGKQRTMVLTVEELEAIRDQAAGVARRNALTDAGHSFSPEEMQAIREQYVHRLKEESKLREDLEWRLRLAIARLSDVESATDKLRAIRDSLKGVLGEVARKDAQEDDDDDDDDDDAAEKTQPRGMPGRRATSLGVPARALRFKRALA